MEGLHRLGPGLATKTVKGIENLRAAQHCTPVLTVLRGLRHEDHLLKMHLDVLASPWAGHTDGGTASLVWSPVKRLAHHVLRSLPGLGKPSSRPPIRLSVCSGAVPKRSREPASAHWWKPRCYWWASVSCSVTEEDRRAVLEPEPPCGQEASTRSRKEGRKPGPISSMCSHFKGHYAPAPPKDKTRLAFLRFPALRVSDDIQFGSHRAGTCRSIEREPESQNPRCLSCGDRAPRHSAER